MSQILHILHSSSYSSKNILYFFIMNQKVIYNCPFRIMKTNTTKRYLSDNFTSFSIRSSKEISSCFSSFFLSFFNTKPGGRAWRYMQLSPPPGQTQNHPYLLFSIASRKYLQTCIKQKKNGCQHCVLFIPSNLHYMRIYYMSEVQ